MMIKLKKMISEKSLYGPVLRVFDFDDTLATTDSYIYVKHKDGSESKLTPGKYAKYKEKPGDEIDYRDFNSLLKAPQIIKKNFSLFRKMLDNPSKKVTILTARGVGYPIKKYFKDNFGLEVYAIALRNNSPEAKRKWIEKNIKRGYKDIAFMDDSIKNIKAIQSLQQKYPDVKIKTVLAK